MARWRPVDLIDLIVGRVGPIEQRRLRGVVDQIVGKVLSARPQFSVHRNARASREAAARIHVRHRANYHRCPPRRLPGKSVHLHRIHRLSERGPTHGPIQPRTPNQGLLECWLADI